MIVEDAIPEPKAALAIVLAISIAVIDSLRGGRRDLGEPSQRACNGHGKLLPHIEVV
jgi:hypothetical protein